MKRRLERRQLRQTTPLTDALSGEAAGHVVDITSEGLMLEAAQPFDSRRVYVLNLQLPEPMAGQTAVRLGVDCLWARPADHFRGHWGGFQIIDASPEALQALEMLMTRYGV